MFAGQKVFECVDDLVSDLAFAESYGRCRGAARNLASGIWLASLRPSSTAIFVSPTRSIPNTLEVRPGYRLVVMVNKDMHLRLYVDRRTVGETMPVSAGPMMQ